MLATCYSGWCSRNRGNFARGRTWENITVANTLAINIAGPAFLVLMWMTTYTSRVYQTTCHIFSWTFICFIAILSSHAAIAIVRCLKVCKPDLIFRMTYIIIGVMACWLNGLVFVLHAMFTRSGILFATQCQFARPLRDSSASVTVIVIMVTCLAALITSYIITFRKLKLNNRLVPVRLPEAVAMRYTLPSGSSNRSSITTISGLCRVRNDGPASGELTGLDRGNNNQATMRYIVRSNVIQFISFLLSGGSAIIAASVAAGQRDVLGSAAQSVGLVTFSLIFFAFVLNPLIYCFRNKRFRAYVKTLTRRLSNCWSTGGPLG